MKGTILASTVVHAALLSVLFVVRPARDMIVPGPDVVQVALLGEIAPPPAPVVKANDAVVPDEPEGVRIEKPRAKPKPEVKQQSKVPDQKAAIPPRQDTPPPPTPSTERRTVLPYAAVGEGISGQVAVDDVNFEFAYYLQMVRAQIARNWTPPAGSSPGARAEVYFRVSRAGEISGLRLEVSSGGEYFDQTALRAVVITQQLPALPVGYNGADLGIHFGFEYTGPE